MSSSRNLAVIAMGAAMLTATSVHSATEQNKNSTAILMQGFHWNSHASNWYNIIGNNANDMKNLGVTHVWFPPPSDAASNEGYLPRQLNNLNSKYGSETQLRNAISALSSEGIKSVADIVINHRVGTTNWADFTNPTWGSWSVTADDEWGQGSGNWDTGSGYSAARDIDHTNIGVRNDIKYWMNNVLKDVGFTGWRYDYSKGYGAKYAGEYEQATGADFCVGEVWTDLHLWDVDSHRQQLMDYINGTNGRCGVFDFTTKGLLNQALHQNEYWRLKDGSGKPAGAIGWWPQKLVTFVDNHDTGPSQNCSSGQNHWAVPCSKVLVGYAYVLTHPGIPTVYWPHVYDWNMKSAIKEMIDVRKSAGLHSTSDVNILAAEQGLYAAIIGGNVAMKIGYKNWNPGSGWDLKASGSDYAIWQKANSNGGSTGGSTGGGDTTSGSYYKVEANHSGKVLDVAGVSTASGGNIHQWAYAGGDNQKWQFNDKGNGFFEIKVKHAGLCLAVQGGSTSNGANVIQENCNNNDRQRFTLEDQGGGFVYLKAKHSNKCVDVAGVSGDNGANIHQWSCVGGDNQKWKLVEVN